MLGLLNFAFDSLGMTTGRRHVASATTAEKMRGTEFTHRCAVRETCQCTEAEVLRSEELVDVIRMDEFKPRNKRLGRTAFWSILRDRLFPTLSSLRGIPM